MQIIYTHPDAGPCGLCTHVHSRETQASTSAGQGVMPMYDASYKVLMAQP